MRSANGERGSLVVTGSSAGGIEALSVFLGTLPADFPAPIVIAQHLDPRVPSSLAAILAKHTRLAVVGVTEYADLLPATVYVVPADRHVEISPGVMRVHDGSPGRPKPSIDLLFATAAAAYGDRLIAIVLTGLGSDGSNGARAVKQHNGTVIIEDPMTASFPSMPASLEPAMVDLIAPLQSIAAEVERLVNESIDLPDDSPSLGALIERVRATSGVDFSHYKPATIKRRLARQIALTGHRTIAQYMDYLTEEPAEFGRLVAAFLIKVTEFFRDREFFELLRLTIIPELIADARHRGGRELRIWSAGCATGEEAYSLAILIAEAIRDDRELFNVRIFATDIDDAAISFARRGVYPAESVSTIDPALVARYFVQTPSGWEVSKPIRNMTVFGQHDLGQRAPFPRIDLTLCRNVLIYFSKDLQARTLQVFAFSIRNGGYLALGKSETTNPLAEYFTIVDSPLRVFRRYGERMTIPAAQVHKPLLNAREIERSRNTFPAFVRSTRDVRVTLHEKLGEFLTTSSIGVVLVDDHYDIITINTSGRAMFNIHGVAIGEDLVHLLPAASAGHVRAMLDAALRNVQPPAGGEEIAVGDDGIDDIRYLALSCHPEFASHEGDITGAVILAVDVTESARSRRQFEETVRSQAHQIDGLRRSETNTRERLRILVEANKKLTQVYSDLRAQNDALVISAEEAEAATEEVETLNEEMQATNEELETLNEEFQATIEELNTTNDEHEARGHELQAQLALRDGQRVAAEERVVALVAIIDDLPMATAAIDSRGTILAANRSFHAIVDAALERSVHIDDDAGATFSMNVVLRRAGEGQDFSFTYRSIAVDQSVRVYLGQARPLPDAGTARSVVRLELAPASPP